MSTTGRRAHLAALAAALGVGPLAGAGQALAAPSYVLNADAGIVANLVTDGQCMASQVQTTFTVICPATVAQNGPKWALVLRSPVPGTVLEAVAWDVGRTSHTPTNIQMEVIDELGNVVHSVGEAGIPVEPAGQAYHVPVSGAQSQLRLTQVGAQAVPDRAYTISNPRLTIRDVQPPTSTITALTAEWIRTDQANISWHVADNLGASGVGLQQVLAGGRTLYVGLPGVGSHSAGLDVARLSDGAHLLGLVVAGAGTADAPPTAGLLRIDRTAPKPTIAARRTGRNQARLSVRIEDATSGVASWTVRAHSPSGRVVATSEGAGERADIDLRPLVRRGGEIRFHLEARDRAGNVTTALSEPIRRAGPRDGRPAYPFGPPERMLEQNPDGLPDLRGVTTGGLRSSQAVRYLAGKGRLRIPVVRAVHGKRLRLSARFLTRSRPLRGATVYLVDPAGRGHARKLTDRGGRVAFGIRARTPGVWRAVVLGRPLVSAPLRLEVSPRVVARVSARRLRPGQTLGVSGRVLPRVAGARKQVQLQALLRGRWRPVTQGAANGHGVFTLRYPFVSVAGSYSLPMRIVVPRERGWPYAPVVAKRFTVHVS